MPPRRLTMPPKTCSICGSQFTRREGEQARGYRLRLTCSHACRIRLKRSIGLQQHQQTPAPTRICVICGDAFHRRAKEQHGNYLKRQSCSRPCQNQLMSRRRRGISPGPSPHKKNLPPKTCVACGSLFTRRDKESVAAFRKRSTCNRDCWRKLAVQSALRASQAAKAKRDAQPRPPKPVKPPKAPRQAHTQPQPTPARPVRVVDDRPRWQPPPQALSKYGETPVMRPDGPVERCSEHGDVIGRFGCPGCVAGARWRERGQIAHVGVGSRP